jgi:cytochrome c553
MRLALLLALLAFVPSAASADAKAGEKKAQLCLLCHKPDPMAWVPTLEGQTREYLYNQIKAFKDKRRTDSAMQTNVATLSAKDARDITDYFASRKPVRGSFPLRPDKVKRGKERAEALGCASCHLSDYGGRKEVPRLAGMNPRYVGQQLIAFGAGGRAHPRINRANAIAQADSEDLAEYFAQLD